MAVAHLPHTGHQPSKQHYGIIDRMRGLLARREYERQLRRHSMTAAELSHAMRDVPAVQLPRR